MLIVRWYKNLNIMPKLLSSFCAVAMVALVIGVISLVNLDRISRSYIQLYEKNGQAQSLSQEVQSQFQTARGSMRDAVLGMLTSAYDLKKHMDNSDAAIASLDSLLPQLKNVIQGDEEQQQYDNLHAAYEGFKSGTVEYYKTLMKGHSKESIDALRAMDTEYVLPIQVSIAFLTKHSKDTAAASQKEIATATDTARLIIIGVSALLFLLTLSGGFLLSRSLSKPLRKLKSNALKLAQGNLDVQMDINRKDEVGVLAAALERVSGSVRRLTSDIGGLSQAAVEGRLQARADAEGHQGEYREVIEGVNATLDAVTGPLAVAANYMERISQGDIPEPITDEYAGEFNAIKDNLNTCIAAVNRLVADANGLSEAAVRGELDMRADTEAHQGEFRRVMEGVNATLDALVGPLNVAADYVERISKGHIPEPIAEEYNGQFNTLKDNLNTCIASIHRLVESAKSLSAAAIRGELGVRVDTTGMRGDFRRIIEGVNATLDAVTGPLNAAAVYVARISRGDIPELITEEYPGEFNTLKDNLNICMTAVRRLIGDANLLSDAAVVGDLAVRADATAHQGDFRRVVEGFNATLDAVVGPLHMAAGYVERISLGDIPEPIVLEYQGEFAAIKDNLNTCIATLQALGEQTEGLTTAARQELFETRGDAQAFQGIYHQIVAGINDTLDVVVERIFWYESLLDSLPVLVSASDNDQRLMLLNQGLRTVLGTGDDYKGKPRGEYLQDDDMERFRAGGNHFHHENNGRHFVSDISIVQNRHGQSVGYVEVSQDVTADQRRTAYLKQEIAQLASSLAQLAQGSLNLNYAAGEGDEYTQSERESFLTIEQDLAAAAGALRGYVGEISQVLTAMASGDLSAQAVQTYAGDFSGISDALNSILQSFNTLFTEMRIAAEQVASGSRQVSDGSQALSQGATEQAGAIEMLTASLTDVAQQTKQNALDASRASDLSGAARDHALDGDRQMKQMQQSMKEINSASASISRVIKVIDDIAFQTNLLALNAAVEAARAGVHGKGFAVVAEEVRNLAARSATAAKETTDMIESSIQKAADGTRIAAGTAAALAKIVSGVEETTGLVGNIATASNDQATAVAQINRGIEQVSQVVQTNSATAEQSAAASEELSSQAESLKGMVSRFRLRDAQSAPKGKPTLSPGQPEPRAARRKISLSDGEFGKY